MAEIDAWARARDPRVVQVSASLVGERRAIEILRADDRAVRDVRPLVRLNVSVTVEQNGRRESASSGAGGRAGFEAWVAPERWQAQVDEALRQALVNLDAVDCPAGEMDVVLGAGWPGVLLHEAIGHGFEGDFHRKGSSVFNGMMGQRVAAPGVTVVDDGSIAGRRGSLSVDDEGTPTSRTVLIEDGIMVGLMHDRLSARQLGVAATGNGRRQSFAHMPMPRMTNTFMEGGRDSKADMIANTKRGLYAANFSGGQVDITNGKFVFQCNEAYLIEDGVITAPVRGATLIGDGATALTKIQMIGDDFAFDPGVGVCGKAGQGVPVGIGSRDSFEEVVLRSPHRYDVPAPFAAFSEGDLAKCRAVAEATLGADCKEAFCGIVLSKPGAPAQGWHADSRHDSAEHQSAKILNVLVALDDACADYESGPTEFVPRSHVSTNHHTGSFDEDIVYQRDHQPETVGFTLNDVVAAKVPRGGAVIFDDRILHRGGANHSLNDRAVGYFSYRRADVEADTHFEAFRSLKKLRQQVGAFDVGAEFPGLPADASLLDGAAGSQCHHTVVEAVSRQLAFGANVGGQHPHSLASTDVLREARGALAASERRSLRG